MISQVENFKAPKNESTNFYLDGIRNWRSGFFAPIIAVHLVALFIIKRLTRGGLCIVNSLIILLSGASLIGYGLKCKFVQS